TDVQIVKVEGRNCLRPRPIKVHGVSGYRKRTCSGRERTRDADGATVNQGDSISAVSIADGQIVKVERRNCLRAGAVKVHRVAGSYEGAGSRCERTRDADGPAVDQSHSVCAVSITDRQTVEIKSRHCLSSGTIEVK